LTHHCEHDQISDVKSHSLVSLRSWAVGAQVLTVFRIERCHIRYKVFSMYVSSCTVLLYTRYSTTSTVPPESGARRATDRLRKLPPAWERASGK
jgi:hypothetical protein